MDFYLVFVTAKDEEEGRKISDHLLNLHLVACANMFPIHSLYWWKASIEDEAEMALLMKTQKRHKESIISEIKKIHSYDVPCIEFIKIESGNPDYLRWIEEETKGT